MKNIRIKRLSLENFKCHKSLVLDFGGGNASIYGDNATGKTSVYDALTWLLFGKDSQGNGEKNIEIKPLNDGGEVEDHLAITAVEAVLLVDETEVALRRTYQEVWSRKRGSSEETFDGNTSEYYVDGVPVKKFAFSQRVSELVDEDTFRMLTSVSHFASGITWQERRATLFRVAGVVDDLQIMATNETFAPLIDGMGRLSLDDYKKKLLAEKKGFVGAKTEIPAKISVLQQMIADVEALDFNSARAEVARLSARRESLEGEILSIEHDTARERKTVEVREARMALEALENENRTYRREQTAGTVNVSEMKIQQKRLESARASKEDVIRVLEGNIAASDARIAESRERWFSVHRETFCGGNCPTCGQALPADQLTAAAEAFETRKAERLREIEQAANDLKKSKATTEEQIRLTRDEIEAIEAEIREKDAEIKAAEANTVEVRDMEGYLEKRGAIDARIRILERELAEIAENNIDVKGKLVREVQEIKADLEKQRAIIGKESVLDYSRKNIEKLQEDARNAARCLESIEHMLYLIDDYARYKTKFVEDSINSLFRIARFRLFREQANGGVEDRCDVVYDGIPYINLNNGARINVGVDIINTLSRAYGVTVPLFVDNAESVTRLEGSESQIIRLVVSEIDKELRVNYEG